MIEKKIDIELGEIKVKNEPESPTNKNEYIWKVGCYSLDKRCIVYFSQLFLLTACIGVSLYQVSSKTENRDFWIGLLSSSVGVLIPNPKIKK